MTIIPWIMEVPVISTAHLHTLNQEEHPCVHSLRDCGWLIFIGEDYDPDGSQPVELEHVMQWASGYGYTWLRFDRDADIHPDLPVFDH